MARIVRYHKTGGPEVLQIEDLDPGKPGPGEVLLEVLAIGLNRAEAAQRGGHFILKPPLPARIGFESSSRIVEVGPGVTDWQVGEMVSTLPLKQAWGANYGVYASQSVWPTESLNKIPEGMDPIQSAASWVAFLTAWGGLVESGKLATGQTLIVTAASSGVGLAAIQVARAVGAIPIATTRGRDKVPSIEAAGAAHIVVTDEQDLVAETLAITNGQGVPLIFDSVAGPFVEKLTRCLAEDGVLMIYGGLANESAEFPRHLAIRKNLSVRGYNFTQMISTPSRLIRARAAVVDHLLGGSYRMPIGGTFALEDIAEAHRTMEHNAHVGKIVVTTS